jgi:TonB-dependent SusC/RagA subfamily outer membrane receptor
MDQLIRPTFGACAVLLALLLTATPAPAQETQNYTITGRVVEANTGSPLPGANVQLRGLQFGTASQSDGSFSFTAEVDPGEYVVVVSFLGYASSRQRVTFGDDPRIGLGTIELEPDVTGLDEVVVTGTGGPTQRRQLGNAISTVDGADIEEASSESIDQALQGKIAGANIQQNSGRPAGGMSIRLRGTSTVLGDANPLIIVDGVIVNNDSPELIDIGGTAQNRLVDLNPNDIARIEVVKGAAAAALYGSRANDGVIQIFTKRGRSGAPRVTFSTRVQTNKIRETLDVNMARNDEGQFLDNSGDPLPEGQRRFDWQDFIFERGWGTEQYLSVNGGDENTQYAVSGAHYVNQGITEGSQFRRGNARVRLDQTLTDWINVSGGAKFAWNRSDNVPHGGVAQSYGALTGFIFGPNTFDPRPTQFGEYPQGSVLANPVEVIDRFDFNQETRRFIGISASITYSGSTPTNRWGWPSSLAERRLPPSPKAFRVARRRAFSPSTKTSTSATKRTSRRRSPRRRWSAHRRSTSRPSGSTHSLRIWPLSSKSCRAGRPSVTSANFGFPSPSTASSGSRRSAGAISCS